jgi:hypothetical protein
MTLKQRIKQWVSNWTDDAPVEPIQIEQVNRVDIPVEQLPEHSTPPKDDLEPWVNISSTTYDKVKGFRIELDWNDAFIEHLRDNGIHGRSDEEVVQKWLGFLYGDLIERLENTVVDQPNKIRVNDFV